MFPPATDPDNVSLEVESGDMWYDQDRHNLNGAPFMCTQILSPREKLRLARLREQAEIDVAIAVLMRLTPAQRAKVMDGFCWLCGIDDPACACSEDETADAV